MNQKDGALPKPFSIDPPSAGTVANPSVPETHELSRKTASQRILMDDSKTPNSSAVPSSPTPCQSSSNPQMLHSTASPNIISTIIAPEKQTKDDLSRQKSLLSSIQSTYSFLYDQIRQLEAGSNDSLLWRISSVRFLFHSAEAAHRQSNTIDDKTSGYWSPNFQSHPYDYIFIIQFPFYGIDAAARHFATIKFAFFPGDYDGLFLKFFISKSGTS